MNFWYAQYLTPSDENCFGFVFVSSHFSFVDHSQSLLPHGHHRCLTQTMRFFIFAYHSCCARVIHRKDEEKKSPLILMCYHLYSTMYHCTTKKKHVQSPKTPANFNTFPIFWCTDFHQFQWRFRFSISNTWLDILKSNIII